MATLFDLVRLLEERHVDFTLGRTRPDTIRVDAVRVGERLEIDVFEDGHVEVSRFLGRGDVEGDWPDLIAVPDEGR